MISCMVTFMKYEKSKDRKVYNFDLDGTLTFNEPWWDIEPKVNEVMKKHLINIFQNGHIIIIWTARNWDVAPETVGWLVKNRIPFHGIMMGKGGADYYIDDKATNALDLLKELEKNE